MQALRVSMEEERARQEAMQKKAAAEEAAKAQEESAAAPAVQETAQPKVVKASLTNFSVILELTI